MLKKLYILFLPIFTSAKIDIKRLARDKVALFFTIVFPLIFLLIFGGIFGGDNDVSFDVAVINNSSSEFSQQFVAQLDEDQIFSVDNEIADRGTAQEVMKRGELDASIILPEEFGNVGQNDIPSGEAIILYDENNASAAQTLESILSSIFSEINNSFAPSEEPFTVAIESTATQGLTQFDYVFAGLLGFSLLTLGIFGPTNVFPRLKQKGVLRRYKITGIKIWQYITANIVSNSVYGLLSVATMFAVAVVLFDLEMRGDFASLIAFIILSAATLFGIGFAIGGWAKNEAQAAPLANIITFPMIFLSGVFFPRFLMPDFLQSISNFLPLTPVVDGTRLIVTEGQNFFQIMPQVGLLVAWAVVIYIVAIRLFRWE